MRWMYGPLMAVALAMMSLAALPDRALGAPDQPTYTVVSEEEEFQLRDYEAIVIAQFTMRGTYKRSVNDGYIKLERYFLGENTVPERIEMTVPVMVRDDLEAGWTVIFVLPNSYRLYSVPTPNDQRIRVVEIPARRMASVQFKGKLNEVVMRDQIERLRTWLDARGIEHRNDFMLAGYDQGWVPKRFRKNEILVTLK